MPLASRGPRRAEKDGRDSAALKGAEQDGTAGFTQARCSGRWPGRRTGTGFCAGRWAATRPAPASATDDQKHSRDPPIGSELTHTRPAPEQGANSRPAFPSGLWEPQCAPVDGVAEEQFVVTPGKPSGGTARSGFHAPDRQRF